MTHSHAGMPGRIARAAGGELPFAGHPTLGSCHAWLPNGGQPKNANRIVQECGIGAVSIRRDGARLAFAAPPLLKTGGLDEPALAQIAAALNLRREEIVLHQWVDNGPGWAAVMLDSAEKVLSLRPNASLMCNMKLGEIGPYAQRKSVRRPSRRRYLDWRRGRALHRRDSLILSGARLP